MRAINLFKNKTLNQGAKREKKKKKGITQDFFTV